jgi:tRNA threonylcarbamoyladenosine biosynthesis protein TsaE
MRKEWTSSSLSDTETIAHEVGELVRTRSIPRIFFLRGDIGSGKTTFVRLLLKDWGIEEGVASPTFSIIHHYLHPTESIYHVDLYRLRSEMELEDIGIFELFSENNLVFVEWPDLLKEMKLPVTILDFTYGDTENTRRILLQTRP